MKIEQGVLEKITSDDISENGKIIIPEGTKEIRKGTFRFCMNLDKEIRIIELPSSLEYIDPLEFENLLDLVELYVPDGIKKLKITPYTQQIQLKTIGKTCICYFGRFVNPWQYLRLPQGFKLYDDNDQSEVLNHPLLVVDVETLERIIAENRYNGESVILNIKNVSELPVEKLEQFDRSVSLQSIQIIDIESQSLCHETCYPYDIETYKKCKKRIDEIVAAIDFQKYKNLPDREKYIFGEIIRQLSQIPYDRVTIRQGNLSPRRITSRNLISGLLDGTCVCVGYCEILRNILACCNIESKIIAGKQHCWNQVKLDGSWYNTDFTFDQPKIKRGKKPKFTLKSDKDFKYHFKEIQNYLLEKNRLQGVLLSRRYSQSQLEKCSKTASRDELLKYIYGTSKRQFYKKESDNKKYFKPLPDNNTISLDVITAFIEKHNIGFKTVFTTFKNLIIFRKRDRDETEAEAEKK